MSENIQVNIYLSKCNEDGNQYLTALKNVLQSIQEKYPSKKCDMRIHCDIDRTNAKAVEYTMYRVESVPYEDVYDLLKRYKDAPFTTA